MKTAPPLEKQSEHIASTKLDSRIPGVKSEFHMRLRFRGCCSCGWESARTLSEEQAFEWADDHVYAMREK